MRYLLLLVCCLLNMALVAQEKYFVVKDSLTKETLPYATIDFLNGYGVFSDENGKVILDKEFPEQLKVSFMGYEAKRLVTASVLQSEVLLKPAAKVLEELKIVVDKEDVKNRKTFVVKPVLHDNIDKMYWSSLGQQYAFYIPKERKRGILKAVSIPLIVKDLYQGAAEEVFEDKPYGTMMKIEFMKNETNMPGEKLYDYDKVFVVQSGKVSQKIDVSFEENVPIPDEGLFLVMTVLGKTDESGEYKAELPFGIREVHGVKKKYIKIILPNYPLAEAPKGTLTLFRHTFNENQKWSRINRPMVYKKDVKYPMYNIGIGYTVTGYN
ncbi:hypothetical protein ABGT15_01060 [Flavobacterium enshiense]|uniref:hypothetical protein n=1 Tax=Flavobacterium enshiense TaxID=1341165 RepID=UPI00345DB211